MPLSLTSPMAGASIPRKSAQHAALIFILLRAHNKSGQPAVLNFNGNIIPYKTVLPQVLSKLLWGCGVVVSHPLRMRRVPGSNPGVSICMRADTILSGKGRVGCRLVIFCLQFHVPCCVGINSRGTSRIHRPQFHHYMRISVPVVECLVACASVLL